MSTEHIGVVVPVANEAERLGRCLKHIAEARAHLRAAGHVVAVRVVVVLDDCHDASEQIARRFDAVEIVQVKARCVGSARRFGAGHVLGSDSAPERTWLANTDADSCVPHDWLTGMLAQADSGAQVVLGTVIPEPGLLPNVAFAWHMNHPPTEGHPYVHGANFGIRADVYLRLGGWPELVSGEDVALAARAEAAADLQIIRTATAPVLTSARLHARAPHGFSTYLADLGTAPHNRDSTRNEQQPVR